MGEQVTPSQKDVKDVVRFIRKQLAKLKERVEVDYAEIVSQIFNLRKKLGGIENVIGERSDDPMDIYDETKGLPVNCWHCDGHTREEYDSCPHCGAFGMKNVNL